MPRGVKVEATEYPMAVRPLTPDEGCEVIAEHVEVETGKGNDALDRRTKLAEALAKARRAKVPVVVAKLCRLSRDVAFISGLMAQRAFIVAELGADAVQAENQTTVSVGKSLSTCPNFRHHLSGIVVNTMRAFLPRQQYSLCRL
jgi:hypothetical protein